MAQKKPVSLPARVEALEKKLAREVARRKRAEHALAESTARQTATSEILRIISASPNDAQPVFDAIVTSAMRLCNASQGALFTYDGALMHVGGLPTFNSATAAALRAAFPMPATSGSVAGRAILSGTVAETPDILDDPEYTLTAAMRESGVRANVSVPLLLDGRVLGALNLGRPEPGRFAPREIELLKTFADQAVIAIENVRLFTELEARNADVTEALEQQTATAEILRVISRSGTDVQPVFDAIAESALRLLRGWGTLVMRLDGELLHLAAVRGGAPGSLEETRERFPQLVSRGTFAGDAVLDRDVKQIADIESDDRWPHMRATAKMRGWRAALVVPMLQGGQPIGVVTTSRVEPGAFPAHEVELLKTFADQAVIAIENARLLTELQARNADVTEALEQQTATSEILRVISSSPTSVDPVFNAIVRSASELCGGTDCIAVRFDGELMHLLARHNPRAGTIDAVAGLYPRPAGRESSSGRAILDRITVHVADVREDPTFDRRIADASGLRAVLAVPMERDDAVIGAISVSRPTPGPFSAKQIGVLQTFADQAVIAIENVRLFTELDARNRDLTTALDTQTATSDILRVISRSQTDVQPVFDAIVASAVRLLQGYTGTLTRIAGEQIELGALMSTDDAGEAALRATYPRALQSDGPHAQAMRARAPLNIADGSTDPRVSEAAHAIARARGFRSLVVVPLLRHDEAIGTIGVTRREPGGFTDDEISLLKTFADQAVIAIENARLLTELQARNDDLTESLDRQTATAEILRVISSSPTDVQPVFDTIVRSGVTLCDGLFGALYRFDGESISLVAHHNLSAEALGALEQTFPMRANAETWVGQAILAGAVIHIPDVNDRPDYNLIGNARAIGYRSALAVPMLRDGVPIGVIRISRAAPEPFSDNQIALVKTFADQAVIAIENVRLFTELQARTQELTRSVGQLTALGEVGQAVSSSLDLETVLSTIIGRAVQLAGAHAGTIWEYDDAAEEFRLRITQNADDSALPRRDAVLKKGEGAVGRLAITHEPVQIPDITREGAYEGRLRDALVDAGTRALLAVPLLREGRVLGGLVMSRRTPGEFAPEVVDVLKTFATQSALAIQNARLFREIEAKGRALAAASQHKSEFLANMSHELRTPLNAIIGFSEVLGERMFGDINEKQEEYVQDILGSGRHLLSLINDILDLSKIEAGRMELDVEEFDLPQAIGNALTLVRERAGRRGITLGETIDDRLGAIRGDERKVKQVLLNLLSNALKFTPEGGRIDVRAAVADGTAEISVTDTGVGIAEEDQDAVFEEFRQVGAADKKVEGTGLGLPLARKFVELHGGRLWLKSQPGTGSTFTFTLPLRA